MIRQFDEEDIDNQRFDPIGIVEINPLSNIMENAPSDIMTREKGFLATELRLMFKNAGFKVENIRGGTAGSWNKERLKMDEMELMVIGTKV